MAAYLRNNSGATINCKIVVLDKFDNEVLCLAYGSTATGTVLQFPADVDNVYSQAAMVVVFEDQTVQLCWGANEGKSGTSVYYLHVLQ